MYMYMYDGSNPLIPSSTIHYFIQPPLFFSFPFNNNTFPNLTDSIPYNSLDLFFLVNCEKCTSVS